MPSWGDHPVEIRVIRVPCGGKASAVLGYPVYHWGICIGSDGQGWLVINRDQGLGLAFEETCDQAKEAVRKYLSGPTFNFVNMALSSTALFVKSYSYLPRSITSGSSDMARQMRHNNGTMWTNGNWEYQKVAKMSFSS